VDRYIFYVLAILGAPALALFVLVVSSHSDDHLLAQPFPGVPRTYRAFNNYPKPEIQDREIYFHNIGLSIQEAKRADIIILGHSSVLYALDDDQIRAFDKQHKVRIFNMASAGNASGDFIRAVIKRWDIRPKLWVINVDDEPVSFFHPGVDDYGAVGESSAPEIVKTSRLVGFLRAYRRNFRWWLGDQVGRLPRSLRQSYFPSFESRLETWRSTETGDWLFARDGGTYDRATTKLVPSLRSCPVKADEIESARRFLEDIGRDVVFTLVPWSRWCPQHTTELAAVLGVEAMIPPTTDYTSPDGRHMDRPGREAFTAWFLNALKDTHEFRQIATEQDHASRRD
jgi:hypothetical protein